MNDYIIIILLMSIVTLVPRILPFFISEKLTSNSFLKRFFKYIPYSILGMLIIPDIFYSTGNVVSGIIGFITAFILSFLKMNSIIVIFFTVLIVYLIQ
ncbi:Branched-chain amino acid transport protein (AzlD) [Marinitoga hydrogenitolerans DSM 16785]|uniref:Branched-chain amino acid transport protein (AzlD) n=1 Tax=Marinitoga hydrogenitolerans (strain DSM 16785 / JCM 12826 / AT1271) TaxID=1122195 RepID=A0A1M4SH53_MARH1|nr:AzlD domain-containing protein [Marinitoga hydrogenitolerans]SHE31530.1 Branched-chain amino acid transport protein (AzlD) [Marinitoga hydrogenitolerans DSM 16785]